jgi:hypothetical protein
MLKECDTLSKICESQRIIQDSVIKKKNLNIVDYQKTIANNNYNNYLKDSEIQLLKDNAEVLNKAIRKQKVYKWCAIILGGALSSYVGYKYITK